MARYFLEMAYDGTPYHGWQIQHNAHSVQQEIENALGLLLKHPVQVIGAGRTDTGVHARQMFCHFDTDMPILPEEIIYQLNAITPESLAFYQLFQVADHAHARFHAISRRYQYHITLQRNPLLINRAAYLYYKPDIDLMNKGAEMLLQYTDFSAFSKSRTQVKTNHCNIMHAYWEMSNERELVFDIKANRFLRNMVRAITGTLLWLGKGKISLSDFKSIIESKSRKNAGESVPACGLYLVEVNYPKGELNLQHER